MIYITIVALNSLCIYNVIEGIKYYKSDLYRLAEHFIVALLYWAGSYCY